MKKPVFVLKFLAMIFFSLFFFLNILGELIIQSYDETGLIAAASGQLDALLRKGVTKANGFSNGTAAVPHRYGNANRALNGPFDGIYTNGNGLHV